jgi:hypothetical protein
VLNDFFGFMYDPNRDGILMQASAVAMPLMKFAFGEIKRRGRHSTTDISQLRAQGGGAVGGVGGSATAAPDLDDLVRILQRSENHLLATRVLYGSWHNSQPKAQVGRNRNRNRSKLGGRTELTTTVTITVPVLLTLHVAVPSLC